MSASVRGPDGRRWRVRRRWVARVKADRAWKRFHHSIEESKDGLDGAAGVRMGTIHTFWRTPEGTLVGVVTAVLLLVVFPVVWAALALLVLPALAISGLVAHVVLGRPWVVEAVSDDRTLLEWRVKGWDPSLERVTDVARELAEGTLPPATA